ncbi:MAG: polyphosphate kinase 2 [Candidatus Gracilibacteria bacterium]|nr:polyphosphate kinase 2 [Candidatus Gracilibacteria bacterium]
MTNLFYEIFNKKVELTPELVKNFLAEAEKLFNKFKVDNDVDNLLILKNKIEHLLEEKLKNLTAKEKKEYNDIDDFLDKINEYLEDLVKQANKKELVDVVKEIDKTYRKCDDVKDEDKHKFSKVCIKKSTIEYEKELIELQVELLKLQKHIKETGQKLLLIFEGRDAAGKGSTIKRFTEYLNPRGARVVALEKPSEIERTQWYFQRYIKHLPAGSEMVFFDRSWYNRGGVEPVMGFVSKEKYEQFLDDVPKFEKMLVESGIKIIKFYFSVSKDEQKARFDSREFNPLKQYKLSPIDKFSQQLWDKYSLAEYNNFKNTHHKDAPWVIINSDDKKKARLNAIKYVLNQYDYPEKIEAKKLKLEKNIVLDGKQKVKELEKQINLEEDLFEQ